uniref:Immunoglobulin V-set domain-containing protein n=1 Tax=Xiphophorus maculatus TaxID=8083 RepID=A0A3B5RDK3_XIPMA
LLNKIYNYQYYKCLYCYNITLEWTFTTKTQGTWRDLFIYCSLVASHKELILYQVHEGVEFPESQDEQFSGRVQSDKDVLSEGRIRLHVLKMEDSGFYVCKLTIGRCMGLDTCDLTVTGKSVNLYFEFEHMP